MHFSLMINDEHVYFQRDNLLREIYIRPSKVVHPFNVLSETFLFSFWSDEDNKALTTLYRRVTDLLNHTQDLRDTSAFFKESADQCFR